MSSATPCDSARITAIAVAVSSIPLMAAIAVAVRIGAAPHTLPLFPVPLHGGPEIAPQEEELGSLRAGRLQRRLVALGMESPGPAAVDRALDAREELLTRSVTVTLVPAGTTATFALKDHPEWLRLETSVWAIAYRVDKEAVRQALERGDIAGLSLWKPSEVLSTAMDNKNILRATMSRDPEEGYTLDTAEAAARIATALERDGGSITLNGRRHDATVTVTAADGTQKTLTLLGTGLSDFADSTPGRLHNVHKVIDEHLDNMVIPPGGIFSMVDAIDAPVTLQKGWKEDLGLFGGGVALTPGAGICQGATTTYRAALLSGLPIVYKRNHSLFVDHYEFFGLGLDATVFPGVHDMKFRNDTSDVIVLQAHTSGDTAVVRIFGVDDGRTSTLTGPFFPGSKDRDPLLRPLGPSQIGWVRTIQNADGSIREQDPIVASYAKAYPRALKPKYEGRSIELLETRE